MNLGISFDIVLFGERWGVAGAIIDTFAAPIQGAIQFAKIMPKLLMWDYGWLEGTMVYLKMFFYVLSAGLVMMAWMIFRRQ